MRALVLVGPGKIEWREYDIPVPAPGQALVKMKAASLNRRDEWIKEGKYPNIRYGAILGSDGSGIVSAVGDASQTGWVGKQVVINPNVNWGPDPNVQSKNYSILGMPVSGTFAEYCLVDMDRLEEKPAYLDVVHAAAIPLGGLTAYRALFRQGGLRAGQNVLVSGFGGGVAQFCFFFAHAAGANVYVTSGSDAKIARAMKLGAKGAYNYKKENTFSELWRTKGGFDLVIDSAGGDQVNNFIKILKPCGKIVFYGATNGLPSKLDLYRMFWNHLTLQGTTMGNDQEFREMLTFMAKHEIRPMVDSIRPFARLAESFADILLPDKVGKIVFQIG
jgi:zinc-binding alcohol dehydrogenase/oxidoreductase